MAFDRCSIKDYLLTYLLNIKVAHLSTKRNPKQVATKLNAVTYLFWLQCADECWCEDRSNSRLLTTLLHYCQKVKKDITYISTQINALHLLTVKRLIFNLLPGGIGRWVDLDDWLHIEMVYLSRISVYSNRVQRTQQLYWWTQTC